MSELSKLPKEVKRLIRDGVYSLYRVKVWIAPSVEFLLMTDTGETFVMNQEGTVLECPPVSKNDLEFVEVISLQN